MPPQPDPPAYRTLGLDVPVTEVLNAQSWRDRYAYGLVLGIGESLADAPTPSALDQALGCRGRAGTAKTAVGRAEQTTQEVVNQYANALPDTVIRWQLRAALSELEIKLGIPLGCLIRLGDPVDDGLVLGQDYDQLVPRKEFTASDQRDFYRIDLPAGTISVERVRAFWFGELIWSVSSGDLNGALLRLEHPNTASLHIMPQQGATLLLAVPGIGGSAYGSLQMMNGYPSTLPAVWSVDYTMGPRSKYGDVGRIEVALAHWVYCKAGRVLLSLAGLRRARGIQSSSLSFDGLSKSVTLNQGGIYKALEDRLKEAEESLDWKALRTYKRGMRVRPYGG